ncbi:proto-oncogene serine/threonine-protein kinase mos [Thomomys bottae]
MPSPLALRHGLLGEPLPPLDSRPCSSPSVLPGKLLPGGPRLPRRLARCFIDWEQVHVLHKLGSGGFGSVYKATYYGVPVAIKQVNRSTKDPRASQRSFWAELNVARLRHDNIVRVVAATTRTPAGSNSLGTIIMEFGGEATLHQLIYGAPGHGEPPSVPKCVQYSLDVAQGLLFLHSQSIVHLDLKPANILISEQDVCKIGDFGCSQKLEELQGSRTPPRPLGGTYTHRAPELLVGDPVSPKADIYSFGITLWQMVTRDVPYSGDRQYVLYSVVASQLRPCLAKAVFTDSLLGPQLQSLIRCCWEAVAQLRPCAEQLLVTLNFLKVEWANSEPAAR